MGWPNLFKVTLKDGQLLGRFTTTIYQMWVLNPTSHPWLIQAYPRQRLTRTLSSQLSACLPPANEVSLTVKVSPDTLNRRIQAILSPLPSVMLAETGTPTMIVSATYNCWSRAARRKKDQGKASVQLPPGPPALVCQLRVAAVDVGSLLHCRWLKGEDRPLFDSFWNHLSRKISESQPPL